MTKPSQANMGTYDQSEYPELWRNCVRAIAPCLGVSRHMQDYSRRNVVNTLSGSAGHILNGWVRSEGQWAFYPTAAGSPVLTVGTSTAGRTTAMGAAARFWSISQWAYPLAHTAGQVLYYESANSSAGTVRAGVLTGTSGTIDITIRDTDGGGAQTWITNGTTPLNRWSHVAVTVNRFTGVLQAFINGVQQTFSSSGTVGIVDWASTESHSSGTRWGSINGYIDDLMIHHRILSPNEIQLLSRYRGIAYTRRRFRRAHYDMASTPPAPTIRFFPRRIFNRVLP